MQDKALTYRQFLEKVSGSTALNKLHDLGAVIKRFQLPKNAVSRYAPVTFILDYATRRYIYVDEACFDLLGYTASYFFETGLDEYVRKWHPADYQVINDKVFPDNLNFIATVSPETYADYIFSHNYRVLNAAGEFVNVIQRFSFIPDPGQARPTGVIGIVFDITHFKNDQSIVHTIEQSKEINGNRVQQLVYKKIHPVYEAIAKPLISKRELDVLKCMAEGLSSKRIAEKLKLSVNTVNNHRKNMLQKTSCRSAGELMNHAIKHGLI